MKFTKNKQCWYLVCSLVICVVIGKPAIAKDLPNIVLILSDDQAWNDYSFMGHPHIQTPNLDKLAREGVSFKRGYVPTALCRPSLLTIATGLYASQHGITGNDPALEVYGPRDTARYNQQRENLIKKVDEIKTLPELLRAKGYISFQSGKWWEGSFARGGFDHGMTRGFPEKGGRHGDDGLKIGRQGIGEIKQFINTAIDKKAPFLVWYAPFLPHTPHNPPKRLLTKYEQQGLSEPIAKYYAMVEWFDETNGELLNHLDEKGLTENTLVIYVTDNGWINSPTQVDRFLPKSKQSPGEGGVRTPILFKWPKAFPAQTRTELVSSIDIVPTVLGAVGIDVPDSLPGLNLFEQLKNQQPIERNTIFGEGFAHDIADVNNPESSLMYRWVIEDQWKLILSYDGKLDRYVDLHTMYKGPQLYHLATDPHEKTNLIDNYPKVAKRLKKSLDDWYPIIERKILE